MILLLRPWERFFSRVMTRRSPCSGSDSWWVGICRISRWFHHTYTPGFLNSIELVFPDFNIPHFYSRYESSVPLKPPFIRDFPLPGFDSRRVLGPPIVEHVDYLAIWKTRGYSMLQCPCSKPVLFVKFPGGLEIAAARKSSNYNNTANKADVYSLSPFLYILV